MSETQEAARPKVFVSAPGYNNPQRIGTEKIQNIVNKLGYEAVLPMVSSEIPPVEEAEKCLAALREADLVVVWLDGLTAEGVSIFTVSGVQTKIEINFPPETVELMQAGAVMAQRMGRKIGPQQKKKSIVLPNEVDAPPPVPTSMTIDCERNGAALCRLEGIPMNVPDASVLFEAAYAVASGKPTIGIALVNPDVGMYFGWALDAYVDNFAKLETLLKEYAPTSLEPIGARRRKLRELSEAHGFSLHARRLKKKPVEEPAEKTEAPVAK